jgi:hypothetical protein
MNAGLKDYLARTPVYSRDALRLRPGSGSRSFVFEQRAKSGAWQPVPWDVDRVAIDKWSAVTISAGYLWAVTPSGVVAFQQQGAGSAYLDPDSVTIVRGPVTSDRCGSADIAQHGNSALVRCNRTSTQIYLGTLDGTRDQSVFLPYKGADPFAAQTLVNGRQSNGLWQWTVSSRSGGSAGSVQAYRLGTPSSEQIQLSAGRFDFDGITSLAFFQPGWVELGTPAGWFEAPRMSFGAEQWRRPPAVTTPDPRTVARVAIGAGDQGGIGLCLTTGSTTMFWVLPANPQPGVCHDYLGDDDLWRFVREAPSGGVEMVEQATAARRQLVHGRFTDDEAVGLPVTGIDHGAIYYLVPTRAGVLRLDRDLTRTAVSTPTAGLGGGQEPSVLYMWSPARAAYLAAGQFYSLDNQQLLAGWTLASPSGTTVVAVGDGGQGDLNVQWMQARSPAWGVFSRQSGLAVEPADSVTVDLHALSRYQDYLMQWGQPPASAVVAFAPDHASMYWPVGHTNDFAYPAPLTTIDAVQYGRRVLVIGSHDLYEFNLEPAMLAAART